MNLKKLILILSVLVSQQAFANHSTYTSVAVDDCVTIDSSEFDEEFEIDYYDGICKGLGGFAVNISGGDLRYSLNLLYRGKSIDGITKFIGFHDLGSDKVEWRYEVVNGKKVYKALIFRISAWDGIEMKNYDILHVVKLKGQNSCTVATLENKINMNEKARVIADNISKYNCLSIKLDLTRICFKIWGFDLHMCHIYI